MWESPNYYVRLLIHDVFSFYNTFDQVFPKTHPLFKNLCGLQRGQGLIHAGTNGEFYDMTVKDGYDELGSL